VPHKITKHYSNGEVTIAWQPHLCIHCANCANGLPEVFKPGVRPWIDPLAASTQALKDQVAQCPSGALSILYKENSEK